MNALVIMVEMLQKAKRLYFAEQLTFKEMIAIGM